ncbi:protein timeless homolog [Anopheles ziemanni]|uniref:protein timeless homolog n=1 Tax=Anopheles coustani TaxID=139045 RepID=UPI002658006C|nr:protein timeless homolog [Anopheles coustani]XP_058168125.1 protein timeless homolog [Anopheles ziemanni]
MSVFFAEIDAICSSLGWEDGDKYHMDPEALQGLKHLIWILKQDKVVHECRRYIGGKRVVQTDLIPMLISNFHNADLVDVLLRLLVNLTFPTLLLYNGNYPKDAVEQRKCMRLIDIAEEYKEAFSVKGVWSVLGDRLEKILHTDWAVRSEADGLIIERILILIRNVLQVPANVEKEKRMDNDASLHDCLLWALHQAGILDLILYILGSPHENRFLIHSLEIVSLVYREQSTASLADATLQRSTIEKKNDEMQLIKALHPPGGSRKPLSTARHSRFRGTYTFHNLKSISEADAICHQSLEKIVRSEELGAEKQRIKQPSRHVKETEKVERKSIFSVRLFLREYGMEILRLYNNMVRQVRRYLDQHSSVTVSDFNDDSYLLWAIRFFLEFNRHGGLKIELVSESLTIDTFHWIITRMENCMENIVSDKTRKMLWARRLHIAVQTYRELLNNLQALEKKPDANARELLNLLQNNIFYVVEYRETVVHLLKDFNETHHSRAYLRDVVEVAHLFFGMLQKFCKGTVRVQERVKPKKKKSNKNQRKNRNEQADDEQEDAEYLWLEVAPKIAAILESGEGAESTLKEDLPTPFDSASSVPIDDQKGDCVVRIHAILREGAYEQAIKMLYAARSVWTDDGCFGSASSAPDEDLMTLKEIFTANLAQEKNSGAVEETQPEEEESGEDEEEEAERQIHKAEKDFNFEDFAKRLIDPKIVRACTIVLSDWEKIKTPTLKAAVTLLYRIAVELKAPTMLFQLSLLRIFQRVLRASECSHAFELRRLAIYTLRQLQKLHTSSPGEVLYAEMLFYKTARIATAIEIGYDDIYGQTGSSKSRWTEEQEEELRRLFMENQQNPQTDQDVIDWLLENIIDRTRTRRIVIKKLKDLGLIFKAPTKRSNMNRAQHNQFSVEEDTILRQLYDEHRFDQRRTLKRIVNGFGKKFKPGVIVKRLITLGLIADASEVKPPKRGNAERNAGESHSDNDDDDEIDEDDDEDDDDRDRSYSSKPLDVKAVEASLKLLGSAEKESVQWIIECLNEVMQLNEDSDPDPEQQEEGTPMVAIAPYQIAALEKAEFKRLLKTLGIMDVTRHHCYHRIPSTLSPSDLQQRLTILERFCSSDDFELNSPVVLNETVGERGGEEGEDVVNNVDEGERSMSPLRVVDDDDDDANLMPSLQVDDDDSEPEIGSIRITNEASSMKRDRSLDSSDSESEMSVQHSTKKIRKRAAVISSDED